MILILKHIECEGPGTIEEYFNARGYELKIVALDEGDPMPRDLSDVQAVIVMGGPMNVYEEEKFPFLKDEDFLIRRIIKEEIPFLGICLGSQLLSKASGGNITKSPVKEIGWYKLQLELEGKSDGLFNGVDEEFDVFHWHEDMFDIPFGGLRLATSGGCPNQALKIGQYAYGLQFHIEVTEEIIRSWCGQYFKKDDPVQMQKAKEMLDMFQIKKKEFNKTALQIYRNFESLIINRKK